MEGCEPGGGPGERGKSGKWKGRGGGGGDDGELWDLWTNALTGTNPPPHFSRYGCFL